MLRLREKRRQVEKNMLPVDVPVLRGDYSWWTPLFGADVFGAPGLHQVIVMLAAEFSLSGR